MFFCKNEIANNYTEKYWVEVTNHSRQAIVSYLEIWQQVCLLYFFRGRRLVMFFFKKALQNGVL